MQQHVVKQQKKKPYLKKIGTVHGFAVWIVDGPFIRKHIDPEFTNFDHHLNSAFIPPQEFWIDQEHAPNEINYFVAHILAEHRYMAAGMSEDKARKKACALEKQQRQRSPVVQRLMKADKSEIVRTIHKRLLYQEKNLNVWLVNGDLVRSLFSVNFTEGGHDLVYSFVPKNEVWIDDDLSPQERPVVLIHELHERFLMAKGWCYDDAHTMASLLERLCRFYSTKIQFILSKELEKNAELKRKRTLIIMHNNPSIVTALWSLFSRACVWSRLSYHKTLIGTEYFSGATIKLE
ncbi:MAG: hypothetical protein HY832_01240 [Candidatus Aenigmarchaeota archaeon]|nr:hypothetical protein [Candidatus Aenigmarchaeota archaeon]